MAEAKKNIGPKQAAAGAKQVAGKAGKMAGDVFHKMKGHFEPAKVDAFQKKWLKVPENRKKYAKMTDAPQVAGEEMLAMANDFVDFIQGQEGGKSGVLKKIKAKASGFFKNPAKFLQDKAAAGKKAGGKTSGKK